MPASAQKNLPNSTASSTEPKAQRRIALIFLAAGLLLCGSIGFAYKIGQIVIQANQQLASSLSALRALADLSGSLGDTEINQRNYLLTGEEAHLAHFKNNEAEVLRDVTTLREIAFTGALPKQQVERLAELTHDRLSTLNQTLEENRTKGFNAAQTIASSDLRKAIIDQIRSEITQMEKVKKADFDYYTQRSAWATKVRNITFLGVGVLNLAFLFWVYRVISRQMKLRTAAVQESFRQREFLATTLRSIGDGVITTDDQGLITFVNPVAENLVGAKLPELAGARLIDVFRILDETTRKPVENPVTRVLQERRVVGLANHTVLISRDGREVPIDDSAAPIQSFDGQMLGVVLVFRDVTRQRASEVAARTLSAIVEHSDDAIYSIDLNTTITSWNRTAEKMFGYTAAEVVGQSIGSLIPPNRPNEEPEILARIRRGEKVEHYQTVRRRKDGSDVDVSLTNSALRDPISNEIIGVSKIARDITKQRAAELTARRLSAIVELSDDAIYSVDLNGVITSWNRTAETMFGYSAEEVVGNPIALLIPPDRPNEEPQILARIRHGEKVEHYQTVRRRKDGTDVDVSLTVSALRDPASNEIIGASKIARDITDRRRMAEAAQEVGARYRTLFNSMDEGFCVIEVIVDSRNNPLDYRFIETNPAFERQSGISNATGRTIREVVPGLEKEWSETYGKVALTGEPIRFEREAKVLNRWFDVYAYRVDRPEQRRVAILFNDITERKKAEQVLAAAKENLEHHAQNLETMVRERTAKLQRTVADLEAFSYTISHDLRSPLRSMQGFAQALEEEYSDKLDAQGRQYLERISKAAIQLDDLIREVLTFSHIGREDVVITRVDLDKVVEEVIQTYPTVRMPHAEITIKHPLDSVMAHPISLVQCISNLLTNAVKFVPAGAKAKIHIWTERHDSKVKLFVKDNGIGIPEELLSKIFEPFQRAHPDAGYEGTGMGLAIVRKALNRMGGNVGVQSQVGLGSTFWLELPAAT